MAKTEETKETKEKKQKPIDLRFRCAVLYANSEDHVIVSGSKNRYTDEIVYAKMKKDQGVVVRPKQSVVPIKAAINSCLANGIYTFYIIAGKFEAEVKKVCDELISKYPEDSMRIVYIADDTGSIDSAIVKGVKAALDEGFIEVFVMSGDTVIMKEVLGRLLDVPRHAMLVKSIRAVDIKREAVAYGTGEALVNGFWFNKDNATELPKELSDLVAYTSSDVFKIYATEDTKKLVDTFANEYAEKGAQNCKGYDLMTNIAYSQGIFPVFINANYGLYNIRTFEDTERVKLFLKASLK